VAHLSGGRIARYSLRYSEGALQCGAMAEPKHLGGDRWAARPRVDGQQRYIVVRASGVREARRKVAEQVDAMRRGELTTGGKPTFAIAAARLLETAPLAPATVANHLEVLKHCAPWAGKRVDRVTVEEVERVVRALTPSTGRRTLSLVSAVLRDCIRLGELGPAANIADRVRRPPTVKRREVDLAATEVAEVIRAARPEAAQLALLWIALTGVRRAELVALRWPDVDLEAGRCTVRRRSSGGVIVDGAKTRAGVRVLPLSAPAAGVLRRMAELVEPGGFVWSPVPDGTMPYRPAWITRACGRAAGEAGIVCSPHRLRHFAASALADAGIPIPSIGRMLGHASVATLSYLHGVDSRVVEAADVLGDVMGQASVRALPPAE
jgi:integrase